MSAKLVGTFVTDVLTNLMHGIFLSLFWHSYDRYFMFFISILYIFISFLKFQTARVFLLQIKDSPPKRNFKQALAENIGNPPTIRFIDYKSPSAPSSSPASRESSRAMSPVLFEYDCWQDYTPIPELKNAECLKVTTTTNCLFTENARNEIEQKRMQLQKNAKPHHYITTSIQSNNSNDYFQCKLSGKNYKILRFLRSIHGRALYCLLALFGYRLSFEYFYYSGVKDYKVQINKYIGVKGDNLRARRGEQDTAAQEQFTMYLKAADPKGIFSGFK